MSPHLKLFVIAVPFFAVSTGSVAQTAQGAIADVQEKPVTQSLNNGVATEVAKTNAVNAANQDQYELDRAAFRAQVAARREKIMVDDAAYARQQAAYADAMAAWRIQNDECKRGILKSCKKPTPVPADFY